MKILKTKELATIQSLMIDELLIRIKTETYQIHNHVCLQIQSETAERVFPRINRQSTFEMEYQIY